MLKKATFAIMKKIGKFMEFLKKRWDVDNDRQLAVIFVVFAVTGTCSILARKYFLKFIGVDLSVLPVPFNYMSRISITMTMYQILLVLIGSIFGQFKFFWNFERKMIGRLIPAVKPKPQTSNS